jgi:hypothetical protein
MRKEIGHAAPRQRLLGCRTSNIVACYGSGYDGIVAAAAAGSNLA